MNDPPRPLTEEDIWFQIGHVHEQQKDVGSSMLSCFALILTRPLVRMRESCLHASARPSARARKGSSTTRLVTSPRTHHLPKAGDRHPVPRKVGQFRYVGRSLIAPSSHADIQQTPLTPKVGICWDGATWPSRNTTKHMRLISKPCTAMGEIQPSGAPLAFCTTKLTSIATLSTPILAQYA